MFIAFNWEAAKYAYLQGKGQLKVIFNTVPVSEVLGSSTLSSEAKEKIRLINEIKRFAVDSMGLSPTDSYTTYYEQNDKPILWVITASPPYELKAKEWHFPIAGTFRYKGYFDEKYIEPEINQLHADGFETRVGEVSAWSTLGILNDPILSSMLKRSEGDLAALIIHEMTHGTVFVKNDLEFNENLADFIGDFGAKWYLKNKYGEHSESYQTYLADIASDEVFLAEMSAGVVKLDSLYRTFSPQIESMKKDSLKYNMIASIVKRASRKDSVDISRYNNAYFVGIGTYRSKQKEFNEMLTKDFGSNFALFLTSIKENSKNLKEFF